MYAYNNLSPVGFDIDEGTLPKNEFEFRTLLILVLTLFYNESINYKLFEIQFS